MKVYSVFNSWAMIKIDGEYMIEYDPAKNNIWAQKFKTFSCNR